MSDPRDLPGLLPEGHPDDPVVRPPLTPEEEGASRELGLLLCYLGPEGLIPPEVPREELEGVWDIYRELLNQHRYNDVHARLVLVRERLQVARECVRAKEGSPLFGVKVAHKTAQEDETVPEPSKRSVYRDRESALDEKRNEWYLTGRTNVAYGSSVVLRALVARLSHEVALANRALHADYFTRKVQPWAFYERSHWFTVLTTAKRLVMLGLDRMVVTAERDLRITLGDVPLGSADYEAHILQLAGRVSEMAGPSETGKSMTEKAFVEKIGARAEGKMTGKHVRAHLRQLPLHPETGQNLYPPGSLPEKIAGLLDVLREVRSDLRSWENLRKGAL